MNLPGFSWFLLCFMFCLSNFVHCDVDGITESEKELVAQLKPLVSEFLYKDYMKEDMYLVRFLRQQNNDINRARDMIQEAMEWRKKNKMDTILTEDFSAVEKQYPIVFEGVDNYGHLLAIANVGVIDIRKIALAGQIEMFLHLFTALLELVEAISREIQTEPGRGNVSRAYLVLDLGGFNMRQHWCAQCLQFVPFIFNTLEKYYPDRLYKFVGVNAPRAVLPLYELIRPFMSPVTRNAVHLFGHDTEKWKKFLRADIPEDQLPIPYGGTRNLRPKTLSYLRVHDKYVKVAFEKAKEELARLEKEKEEKTKGAVSDAASTNINTTKTED